MAIHISKRRLRAGNGYSEELAVCGATFTLPWGRRNPSVIPTCAACLEDLPDMRGRLITDKNDPRYLRVIPAMPDMAWLDCPKCSKAPCECEGKV